MLNTIPQDPSSVMRFVDGADERQLMSMVSSKNPYSFMALAKLQSIRDAKMKEQAGQPTPPPLSEQIPQQLAQLASGQQSMQQPMQQPMPPPMQQPMQPQGIASIGGEPTGAGGGMVSFTDGGGVRRFQQAGAVSANLMELELGKPTEESPPLVKPTPQQVDEILTKMRAAGKPVGLATVRDIEAGRYTNITATSTAPDVASAGSPVAETKSKVPVVGSGNASGSDAGITRLNNQPSGGNLNPNRSYDQFGKTLAPLFKDQTDAAMAGITAYEDAQKAMAPYYDPKRIAEFNPTDAERKALRQAEQTDLEKAFPNPYTKTANALELLQKNLENSEGNTFNKALFKASLALMGNKSPRFFQAASEAGLVGVDDYARQQEANQKQKMALMNADTALATAQDSRKRGLYDQSAKQVSESLQFKKDAFLAAKDAEFQQGKMAIDLAGKKAEIPALKLQQAQDLHTLQRNLFLDNMKVAELNLKGQQIAATALPEMAKMLNWAGNHPGRLGELRDAQRREFFVKAATIAEGALSKLVAANPMATDAEKKASYDSTLSSVMASYDKDYPKPVRVP